MTEIKLTKEADTLLCVLYKEYLQRRKSGMSKTAARFFGGSTLIQAKLMPKWSIEDTDETCRELRNAGILDCLIADMVVSETMLCDSGIIYMENRFTAGLSSVISYLERIRSILPW